MENSDNFKESLALDTIDQEETAATTRRLKTYSIDALKDAYSVERVFVAHPKFARVVGLLDRLFQLGTELDTPQGACVVGVSGVGKTAAFKYFRSTLPPSSLFDHGSGIIGLRMPIRATNGPLIRALLCALKYPFSSGTYKQLFERRYVVIEALKSKGTRLIWVDEAHHLIPRKAGGTLKNHEGDATEFLCELMDECRISVVLSGAKELDDLSQALPHLASRISGREVLDEFELDKNWAAFVSAFVTQVSAFDLTPLIENSVLVRLHKATSGNPRRFKQLLIEAVLIARDSSQATINSAILALAYDRAFGAGALRSSPFV
jgi:type II secretory pathway predicted ATPase ExeA